MTCRPKIAHDAGLENFLRFVRFSLPLASVRTSARIAFVLVCLIP